MMLCPYHRRLLARALSLLEDDCYYSFQKALVKAFKAHYNHVCQDCVSTTKEYKDGKSD